MSKKTDRLINVLNKPKQVDEILNEQNESALREINRSKKGLFFSGISAGLEVGFSVFLLAAVYSLFNQLLPHQVLHVLLALAYPVGFIFVIIGKSELFTEHTTLAVFPVLNKTASVKGLLKLWGLIYAGNIIGGYFFAFVLSLLPKWFHVIHANAYQELALDMINHQWYVIAVSGILAGWLMGLLSWLVASSQETISRILIIVLITSLIGIGGLHHCIVGSIEIFAAMLSSDKIDFGNYAFVQTWATLGNMIGGVVFVAFMKFSHSYTETK